MFALLENVRPLILPRYSKWLREGSFALLTRLAAVLFGFLNLLFLVRVVSPGTVGAWVLFTSVTAIIEMTRAGFIRNPILAHLSVATPEDEKKIISSSFLLHSLAGLAISLLVLSLGATLARFWHTAGIQQLFYVYAITNLAMVIFLQFEYLMQWKMNFKGIFISNVMRLGLLSFYLGAQLFLGRSPRLLELAIIQLCSTLLAIMVSRYYVDKECLSAFTWHNARERVMSLFNMGKFTIGTSISSMFIKNTDSWVIGRMLSSSAVAVYNPAIRISNLVEVPTLAVANLIFQEVGKTAANDGANGIKRLYTKSVSLILAIILPSMVLVYFLSDQVINFLFGHQYQEAAVILRVTVFYTLIIPFNRQFGTMMDGMQKPKLNFALLVMVGILNIVFSYLFVLRFGIVGAAYGTLTAYCIVFLLNQSILYFRFGISTLNVLWMIPWWYVFTFKIFIEHIRPAISKWRR